MNFNTETETMIIAISESDCPELMPALAMTYSPLQLWGRIHDADAGLACGTIFPALYKPFLEGACSCV